MEGPALGKLVEEIIKRDYHEQMYPRLRDHTWRRRKCTSPEELGKVFHPADEGYPEKEVKGGRELQAGEQPAGVEEQSARGSPGVTTKPLGGFLASPHSPCLAAWRHQMVRAEHYRMA